ncbi:MAG: RluA family pseudouridine synthase [Deltaproteobacteria bacterium]|nr:RluA family pseudouridine synthase [Deltaproteobacteria bacterium]
MKQWVVAPAEEGQRVDRVLVARSKVSRGQVKRWIDAGALRVNGRSVVIAKWAVHIGDRLTVDDRPASESARERQAARQFVRVLYEDTELIAIDKPAGMLVVPEEGTRAPTAIDAVRAYLRRKYPSARGTYVRALHRLDKGTSGVLLLAKAKSGEAVVQQFKRHRVLREYAAIVHGAVPKGAGTLTAPLAKGLFGRGRKAMIAAEGKPSVTHFTVEERYPQASLLTIRVETGRTHQIRVHLAGIGHPLLGDELYGPPVRSAGCEVRGSKSTANIEHGTPNRRRAQLPAGRQALHATRLKLHHPTTGKPIDLRAPWPKDFERALDRLRS